MSLKLVDYCSRNVSEVETRANSCLVTALSRLFIVKCQGAVTKLATMSYLQGSDTNEIPSLQVLCKLRITQKPNPPRTARSGQDLRDKRVIW